MPTYLSPGVYVEEIPSGSAPIAALSTSTAGFIGIVPDVIQVPISPLMQVTDTFNGDGATKVFNLNNYPVNINANAEVLVIDTLTGNSSLKKVQLELQTSGDPNKRAKITLDSAPTANQKVKVKYIIESVKVTNEVILTIPQDTDLSSSTDWKINLTRYPVNTNDKTWAIKANGGELDKTNISITNDAPNKVAQVTIPVSLLTSDSNLYNSTTNKTKLLITITADYQVTFPKFSPATAGEVKPCTNFNEFKKYFGDFSTDEDQKKLAHAIYGFFNNGGSRCYVSRVIDNAGIPGVLEKFEAIDEIALVAAPGINDTSIRSAIVTHCQNMGDRS